MNNWKITFEVYATKDGIQERYQREVLASASSIQKAQDLFAETLWPQMREQIGKEADYRVTSIEQKLN